MTVFAFILEQFPEFDAFTSDYPAWYRTEMNYGMAIRALEFAQELKRTNRFADLQRLFDHVEAGMLRSDVETPLCIDFVQRISELTRDEKADFVARLGPSAKKCYDLG